MSQQPTTNTDIEHLGGKKNWEGGISKASCIINSDNSSRRSHNELNSSNDVLEQLHMNKDPSSLQYQYGKYSQYKIKCYSDHNQLVVVWLACQLELHCCLQLDLFRICGEKWEKYNLIYSCTYCNQYICSGNDRVCP